MNGLNSCLKLYNNVRIPCIGLGTWQTRGPVTLAAVKNALEIGYRLLDTAAAYGNEISVGQAIKESDISREEVFITSKLRNAVRGYDATIDAFEMTLNRMGVEYLDLYLIHWPNPIQYRTIWKKANADTWRAFEDLYKAKLIRAIGVSNFMPHHIEALMETSEILPMVNQLYLCPGVTQPEVVNYCREKGIIIEAYSPFGTGTIFTVTEMRVMAAKYGKSISQIVLRWCLQMGYIPLPKSANPVHLKENTEIFDFALEEKDVDMISNLKGACGIAPDPDKITF
jgi:diketogulonate reductase-like aldo/keto reductase